MPHLLYEDEADLKAPHTGLEPVTPRLTAVCSTIELLGHLISKSTALLSSSALTPSGAFKTEHSRPTCGPAPSFTSFSSAELPPGLQANTMTSKDKLPTD